MIRYDEVSDLTGEQALRVRALINRSNRIWDMPTDLGTIRAWEEQIADCEAEGVPHLAASGRFAQYVIYSRGGMPGEALETYARLMQIVGRYGDHLHPDNLRAFLGQVADLVVTVGKDPTVPRAQLERVVDLVEKQTVAGGADLASVTLARATLAAEFGEHERAVDLMDQWQGIGSPAWPPFDADTVIREVMILERADPALAARTLSRRLEAMGVPPGPLDEHREDHTQLVLLRTDQGALSARAGETETAARIGDQLLAQYGVERLVRSAEIQDVLLVVEHRPDEARLAADFGLQNSRLDHSEWRLQAALARSRALADPGSEETALLRLVATEAAAAHDARGGTDVHSRELQDLWFAGLPPAPAVADGAGADPQDRAERILHAGWLLRRTTPVTTEEVPVALKDRYVALQEQAMSVLDASSEEEAEALIAATTTRAQELKMPAAVFIAHLMHALRASQADDHTALVTRYQDVQRAQRLATGGTDPALVKAAAGLFLPVIRLSLDLPTISLDRIEEILTEEKSLRALTGTPTTPIAVAELARAAHLGQLEAIGPLREEIDARLEAEARDVDALDVQLDLARFLAPVEPDAVRPLVLDVLRRTNDLTQQLPAMAWRGWTNLRMGRPVDTIAPGVVRELQAEDRDFDEYGDLPRSVLLEVASHVPSAQRWIVEAALAGTTPGDPTHLDTFAGVARYLLENAPEDARGPALREDARRIAADLDRRNGSTVQSALLRERFFPEG